MPFTPTHIAAAVPIAWLCRWKVPFSALAVGCMVPDLGAFFPSLVNYQASHSILGIVTRCLPIGLTVYYLYHVVFKRPLADLLPQTIRRRLQVHLNRDVDFSLRQVALVSLLIVVGAGTHIFWDSFTHAGRWGVSVFPWLGEIVYHWGRWPVPWHTVMQHGSSFVMLPPLIVGFIAWARRQEIVDPPSDRFQLSLWITWTNLLLICLGGVIQRVALHWDRLEDLLWLHTIRTIVRETGAVIVFVVIAFGLAMNVIWIIQARMSEVSKSMKTQNQSAANEVPESSAKISRATYDDDSSV